MHEYPVTCEIIRIAEKHARDNKALKVVEIGLVVGDDSGFIGDSIQMYFDVISEKTLCEGAKISIKHIKPKLKCTQCGRLFERGFLSFACDACGADGAPTDIGKEFYVEFIEVETQHTSEEMSRSESNNKESVSEGKYEY